MGKPIKFKPGIEEKLKELTQEIYSPKMVAVLEGLREREDLMRYLNKVAKSITIYKGGTNSESLDFTWNGLAAYDLERGTGNRKIEDVTEWANFLHQQGYTPRKVIQIVEAELEKIIKATEHYR